MQDWQQALGLAISLARTGVDRRALVREAVRDVVSAGTRQDWLAELVADEIAGRVEEAMLPYIDAPGAVVSGVPVEPR